MHRAVVKSLHCLKILAGAADDCVMNKGKQTLPKIMIGININFNQKLRLSFPESMNVLETLMCTNGF